MSAEIICDACGKREVLRATKGVGCYYPPKKWWETSFFGDDRRLTQSACSDACRSALDLTMRETKIENGNEITIAPLWSR